MQFECTFILCLRAHDVQSVSSTDSFSLYEASIPCQPDETEMSSVNLCLCVLSTYCTLHSTGQLSVQSNVSLSASWAGGITDHWSVSSFQSASKTYAGLNESALSANGSFLKTATNTGPSWRLRSKSFFLELWNHYSLCPKLNKWVSSKILSLLPLTGRLLQMQKHCDGLLMHCGITGKKINPGKEIL